MGIKDVRWRQAPGYCVECGNLRPLDRAAACQPCHESAPVGAVRDWEEDGEHSRWYYERLREHPGTFIILGDYKHYPDWLRDDYKVLGIYDACSPREAVEKFLSGLPSEGRDNIQPIVRVARILPERWEFYLDQFGR